MSDLNVAHADSKIGDIVYTYSDYRHTVHPTGPVKRKSPSGMLAFRENGSYSRDRYYRTWQEAKAALVRGHQFKVNQAQERLNYYTEHLEKAQAVEGPTPWPTPTDLARELDEKGGVS